MPHKKSWTQRGGRRWKEKRSQGCLQARGGVLALLGRGRDWGGKAVDLGRASGVGYSGPRRSVPPARYPSRVRGSRGYAHLESGRHKFGGPQWSDGICGWGHHGVSVPRAGERLEALFLGPAG